MKKLSDIIRVGQVSSGNKGNGSARIAFDDMTDPSGKPFVSGEMQVLQRNTVLAKHSSMPAVGEHVLCIQLPNGPQEGFILGSFNTASNMAEGSEPGVERTAYADGTVVEYNLGTSTATIRGANARVIVEAKEAEVTVTETAKITAKTAEVTAETVRIIGNVEVVGNMKVIGSIDATANIMAAGQSDNHHGH